MSPFCRLIALGSLGVSLLSGCGADDPSADQSVDDVTSVPTTPVKNQAIANCWYYATAGWIESLNKGVTGKDLNLSESYGTYWHWFEEITRDGVVENVLNDSDGYWWTAIDLALRYGVYTGSFIPSDDSLRAQPRQTQALEAINASLSRGALRTAAARKDRALVRSELDKAWKLSGSIVAQLDATFTRSVTRDFESGAKAGKGAPILHPSEISARLRDPKTGNLEIKSVADAMGKGPAWGTWKSVMSLTGERSGPLAWRNVTYPTDTKARRDFLRRIQGALRDGFAPPIRWTVSGPAMQQDGSFRKAPATSVGGLHWSLITDYEIAGVPNFGTLRAGANATEPALEAALAEEATIVFLRIKNSWGSSELETGNDEKGYNDLYMDYLSANFATCEDEKPGSKCVKDWGLKAVMLPPE